MNGLKLNKKKPLLLEFDVTGRLYMVIGDNYHVRLVSNEVTRNVPFHYPSWDDVPEEYKRKFYPTYIIILILILFVTRFIGTTLCKELTQIAKQVTSNATNPNEQRSLKVRIISARSPSNIPRVIARGMLQRDLTDLIRTFNDLCSFGFAALLVVVPFLETWNEEVDCYLQIKNITIRNICV